MLPELFEAPRDPLKLNAALRNRVDFLIGAADTPESTTWPALLIEMEIKKDKRGYPRCYDQGKLVKCPDSARKQRAKAEKKPKADAGKKPAAKKDKPVVTKGEADAERLNSIQQWRDSGLISDKEADQLAAKVQYAGIGDDAGIDLSNLGADDVAKPMAVGKAPAKRLSKADREKLGKDKAAAVDTVVQGFQKLAGDGGQQDRADELVGMVGKMDRQQLAGVLKGLGTTDAAIAAYKGKRTATMVADVTKAIKGRAAPLLRGSPTKTAPVTAATPAAKPDAKPAAKPAAAAKQPKPADMGRADLLKAIAADPSISPAEKREMANDDTDSLRNFLAQRMEKAAKAKPEKPKPGSVSDPGEAQAALQKVVAAGGDFKASMDATDDALKGMSDSVKLALGSRYAGEKLDNADDAEAAIRSHVAQQRKAAAAAKKPAAKPVPAPRKDAFSGGDWAPIKPLKRK